MTKYESRDELGQRCKTYGQVATNAKASQILFGPHELLRIGHPYGVIATDAEGDRL